MNIFDKLIIASTDEIKLSAFLEENIQELYDFLTQSFDDLNEYKDKIEDYILQNLKVIKRLDFAIKSTGIFVTLLLDVSERFSFSLPFQILHRLLTKNGCEIGSRLEASSLFLIGIKYISDYNDRVEDILNKLSDSYNNEEDTEDRVIGTIVNFYAQVARDFVHNPLGVQDFKTKVLSYDTKFIFLKNDLIATVFNLDVTDETSYSKVQKLLDVFLKRTKKYSFPIKDFLIEKNTEYSSLLEKIINPDFDNIRRISVKLKPSDDSIFYSLQRGVKILTEEKQLYSYLFSFGKMHYKKMTSSFAFLPDELFNNKLEVIDWGCGQALATISLLDYLKEINKEINLIKNVTLIEPSELAIKRASLHVKKFNTNIDILTINKDLDSLSKTDFNQNNSNIKVHLFSNILDIDLFSMTQLVELIKTTFNGENYFICASPYITDLKTSRLNSFVKSFSTNVNFNSLKEIDNKKGEWSNGWTRVIRIFKADI